MVSGAQYPHYPHSVLIGEKLLYTVVLVSALQHRKPALTAHLPTPISLFES